MEAQHNTGRLANRCTTQSPTENRNTRTSRGIVRELSVLGCYAFGFPILMFRDPDWIPLAHMRALACA